MSLYVEGERRERLRTDRLVNLQGAVATMRRELKTTVDRIAAIEQRGDSRGGMDAVDLHTLKYSRDLAVAAIAEVDAEIYRRLERYPKQCPRCAGTGDAFDRESDDWKYPREPCEMCRGHGEIDEKDDPDA